MKHKLWLYTIGCAMASGLAFFWAMVALDPVPALFGSMLLLASVIFFTRAV